ncbi:MAG: hypothetical protein VZR00_05635 [Lachnospiraceae bacterium]|jgi:hypothetical protein|nr:hypothetical protein [Lachnospiraceae bacterium]MEE3461360.1 hypothetical protein [Lachnospiraceae bacterium]
MDFENELKKFKKSPDLADVEEMILGKSDDSDVVDIMQDILDRKTSARKSGNANNIRRNTR